MGYLMIPFVPDHPHAVRPKITVVHNVFPTCVHAHSMPLRRHPWALKIARQPVITDDLECASLRTDTALVIRNDQSEVQRPEACCLIRFVSSVTWLNTLRRSAMRVRIFRSACITVVWSRPPNCCPIFGSDKSVSSRHRYIAI